MPRADDDLDALYALPLDDFTQERNARAKRLAQEGKAEAATALKAIRKPTVGAWLLNQLSHRHRDQLEAFLLAGAEVATAQRALLAGEGRAPFDKAMSALRQQRAGLLARAKELAEAAGQAFTVVTSDKLDASLRAAAVGGAPAETLREGRLSQELTASPGGASVRSPTRSKGSPHREATKSALGPAHAATSKRAVSAASAPARVAARRSLLAVHSSAAQSEGDAGRPGAPVRRSLQGGGAAPASRSDSASEATSHPRDASSEAGGPRDSTSFTQADRSRAAAADRRRAEREARQARAREEELARRSRAAEAREHASLVRRLAKASRSAARLKRQADQLERRAERAVEKATRLRALADRAAAEVEALQHAADEPGRPSA